MKRLRISLFIATIICFSLLGTPASALNAAPFEQAPQLPDSPVLVTAYSLTNAKPDYVELFNSSSVPINLDGWKLEYTSGSDPLALVTMSGWIAPSDYVIAAHASVVDNADFLYELKDDTTLQPKSVELIPPVSYAPHEVTVGKDGMYQRKISTSTGKYLSTFETTVAPTLYGGGFYSFPEDTSLQFSEILAHPIACSPNDDRVDCLDYVKLYNPSSDPIDLSSFRLRVGYKGQSPSASNTYELGGVVQPGHFATITDSADGRPISVTNSGGFVWLEDAYGIVRYDATIQSYEDASADSKQGQAWAYDVDSGSWKWSSRPTPGDTPSVFPVSIVEKSSVGAKIYVPCKAGQYRSEATNRCRTAVAPVSTALKSCAVNQYRSPETNRCRSLATASANPLKPCASGQERNAETNRCRKVNSDVPKSNFSVEPLKETGKAFAGWWAFGGVGTLAAGYGIWEWRRDVMSGVRKVASFFTAGK